MPTPKSCVMSPEEQTLLREQISKTLAGPFMQMMTNAFKDAYQIDPFPYPECRDEIPIDASPDIPKVIAGLVAHVQQKIPFFTHENYRLEPSTEQDSFDGTMGVFVRRLIPVVPEHITRYEFPAVIRWSFVADTMMLKYVVLLPKPKIIKPNAPVDDSGDDNSDGYGDIADA